jgi:hypothetical protein
MIIDVHVHMFETKMMNRKMMTSLYEHKRSILSPDDFKNFKYDGTLKTLIKDMDEAGIDISVCLPIDLAFMTGEEAEVPVWQFNEYVAEAQAKYPERIIGFFGCDPMRPGSVEMLEKGIKELKLKGVKIFPGWFYPSDERVSKFMQKIEELGVPLLIHSGADPHPFSIKFGDPRYLDDVLLRFPKLKMVSAHIAHGFEELFIKMALYRPGRIWTDLAAWQYEHVYSQWHFLTQLRHTLDLIPNAVLFGSDWPLLKSSPFVSQKGWVEFFKNLKLSQPCLEMGMKQFTAEEKRKLLGENARVLLNLK